MQNLLTLDKLCFSYQANNKAQKILDQVHYQFKEHTFYTIIGPSGAGKTTLLSIMAGLDVPDSGQVLFNQQDVSKSIGLSKYRQKYCSIVFQAYNLIPYMTALQNVITAMGIQHTKDPNFPSKKEKAIQLLNEMGLDEHQMKSPVLKLSGGQQQRVTIARALSSNAPIIFADEPTGNLDHETSQTIIQLFQKLAHEKGKCIIMVTHDLSIANVSDVKLRLKGKKLVEY
ncbi:ABC transporter ATP-binding protein [Listeria costaricensis]|uniref:ABC transporter ATP-binding protein n=1 Tax=Listeria costaricensis TaxID=2026604 RepID=UPI000C06994A|nr:ABC transporter ATP-binding protein [Listeria costaricensis]